MWIKKCNISINSDERQHIFPNEDAMGKAKILIVENKKSIAKNHEDEVTRINYPIIVKSNRRDNNGQVNSNSR